MMLRNSRAQENKKGWMALVDQPMKKIAFIALGLPAGKEERPEAVRASPLQTPPASALGSHACVALSSGPAKKS